VKWRNESGNDNDSRHDRSAGRGAGAAGRGSPRRRGLPRNGQPGPGPGDGDLAPPGRPQLHPSTVLRRQQLITGVPLARCERLPPTDASTRVFERSNGRDGGSDTSASAPRRHTARFRPAPRATRSPGQPPRRPRRAPNPAPVPRDLQPPLNHSRASPGLAHLATKSLTRENVRLRRRRCRTVP
jgi:hypothetical protein